MKEYLTVNYTSIYLNGEARLIVAPLRFLLGGDRYGTINFQMVENELTTKTYLSPCAEKAVDSQAVYEAVVPSKLSQTKT